jgi:chromosome segregation ATPase
MTDIQELEAQVAALREERDALKVTLDQLSDDAGDCLAATAKLMDKLGDAEAEVQRLTEALQTAREDARRAEDAALRLSYERDELKAALRAAGEGKEK